MAQYTKPFGLLWRLMTGVIFLALPAKRASSVAFLDWLARTRPDILRLEDLSPAEIKALKEQFKRHQELEKEMRQNVATSA